MRELSRHALSLLGPALLAVTLFPAACSKAPAKERVLLIGNSFTSANGMPSTLRSVASSLGCNYEISTIAPGGFSFEQHSREAATLKAIKEGGWNAVLLQEQSQRPAWPQEQFESMVRPYALSLGRAVRTSSPEAKVIFYATWGYKSGDPDNCREVQEVCDYDGMQKKLDAAYELLAGDSSGITAPVGKAWAEVRSSHPEIELYSSDGRHPSPEGSYLAACVLFSVISGKSPVGAASPGIPDGTAAILQEAAGRATGTLRR